MGLVIFAGPVCVLRARRHGRRRCHLPAGQAYSEPSLHGRPAEATARCPEPCRLGSSVKLLAGRTEKTELLRELGEGKR